MAEHRVQIERSPRAATTCSGPGLAGVGQGHGKSVAQVVLGWLIQRGVVVIPKSVRRERMAENIDVFDVELSADVMLAIAALDTGVSLFFDHRDPAMVHAIGTRKLG